MRSLLKFLIIAVFGWPLSGFTQQLVTLSPEGDAADNRSDYPVFSADGRYLAFESRASNLVAGDTNGMRDVFVLDRQTSLIELVSLAANNTQGNGDSSWPAISADGRHVVFLSQASNLAPADSGLMQKVLVRDRVAGTTTLISITTDDQLLNGNCLNPTISADGRYVVFDSYASNLLANDSNGVADVVLVDRGAPAADGAFTGQPTVMRVAEINGTVLAEGATNGAISGDGQWLVFASKSELLAQTPTDSYLDIFLKHRISGAVTMITHGTGGNSADPRVSHDASFVVFSSRGSSLVADDSNGVADIFVYEKATATISLVSAGINSSASNGSSGNAHISQDGHYILFDSLARNLSSRVLMHNQRLPQAKSLDGYFDAVTSATGSGSGGGPITELVQYVYLFDRLSGVTRTVSLGVDGGIANSNSYNSNISADGAVIGFGSVATNLVCADSNGYSDVFIEELALVGTSLACANGGETAAESGKGASAAAWSFPVLLIMVVFLGIFRCEPKLRFMRSGLRTR